MYKNIIEDSCSKCCFPEWSNPFILRDNINFWDLDRDSGQMYVVQICKNCRKVRVVGTIDSLQMEEIEVKEE